MKPDRIILVRHGQSEGNAVHAIYKTKPDYALTLTELGHQQTQQSGHELLEKIGEKNSFCYVSPFFRTRETAHNLNLHLKFTEIREDPRLREQEWGHLRKNIDYDCIESERDSYGHFYYRFPNGESCADVFDRISDFLGTLHRDFSKPNFPKNCIIVSHGMTLRLFLMRWLHASVEEFEQWANPKNAEYFILEKSFNDYGKYYLQNKLRTHLLKHNFQYKN